MFDLNFVLLNIFFFVLYFIFNSYTKKQHNLYDDKICICILYHIYYIYYYVTDYNEIDIFNINCRYFKNKYT